MPVVFVAKCGGCGYQSRQFFAMYHAVAFDDPQTWGIRHPEDPRLIVLMHPGERAILGAIGETWQSVSDARRLVRIHTHVCKTCGNLAESRKLERPSLRSDIWDFLSPSRVGQQIARSRNPRRLRRDFVEHRPVCSHCHGTDFAPVVGTRTAPFPCPTCARPTLRVESVGIS